MAPDAEKIHETGNIYPLLILPTGDVAEVFERDDVVVIEHTDTLSGTRVSGNGGGCLAKPGDDGSVEIFCPAQYGYRDQRLS